MEASLLYGPGVAPAALLNLLFRRRLDDSGKNIAPHRPVAL